MDFSDQYDSQDLELEKLKDRILDAISEGRDKEAIRKLLNTYESKYGQDEYWKVVSFDMAELEQDSDTMQELHESIDYSNLGVVTRQINAARIQYVREDYQAALDALDEVDANELDDNEESLVYLHLRGILEFGLKNYDQAAKYMEDVSLDIEDEQIFAIAGISYWHLEKLDRAAECFEKMEAITKDKSYEWLADLLMTFNEADILMSNFFPPTVQQALYPTLVNMVSISIDALETMIRHQPESFKDIIARMLSEQPENELANYMEAVLQDACGHRQAAKKLYRKVLVMPVDDKLTLISDATSALTLKLQALEWLDYTPQVQAKYLRSFFEHTKATGDSDCLFELYLYSASKGKALSKVVREMFNEVGIPDTFTPPETMFVHRALLLQALDCQDYYRAYTHARYLYDLDMLPDGMTTLLAAELFMQFSSDYPSGRPNPDDYPTVHAYLVDQIFILHRAFQFHSVGHFKKVFKQMLKEAESYTGKDNQWELMHSYLWTILTVDIMKDPSWKQMHQLGQAYLDKYYSDEKTDHSFASPDSVPKPHEKGKPVLKEEPILPEDGSQELNTALLEAMDLFFGQVLDGAVERLRKEMQESEDPEEFEKAIREILSQDWKEDFLNGLDLEEEIPGFGALSPSNSRKELPVSFDEYKELKDLLDLSELDQPAPKLEKKPSGTKKKQTASKRPKASRKNGAKGGSEHAKRSDRSDQKGSTQKDPDAGSKNDQEGSGKNQAHSGRKPK